ncbi:MAG TPA: THUMP domain-containing protein [Candidatus Nitrosocosmicus sp.]|jgi:tRNA acetyltransferase TAN1|nr:THUMP domain-containing protein [Candidatus Nitrosocosmicus sp.]
MNFNLLVTTSRYREDDAFDEILELLDVLGDNDPSIEVSSVSGIILVDTILNPFQFVEDCKEMVRKDPWKFRYVLRVIPLEMNCKADLTEIHDIVNQLSRKIDAQETYRVLIEKRHSRLHSSEIISTVTSKMKMKVNLDSPNWIILIQIVKMVAGISILRPNQIFSSVKEKIS